MADSLRILLRPAEVIAPDVPIESDAAFNLLKGICEEQKPDLIVGLSLGGFWAQKLRGYRKILVNPDFHVSRLLRLKVGEMEYLSPRADGQKSFFITDEIAESYREIEKDQFKDLTQSEIDLTYGMFALQDEMVHCGDEFELHYPGKGLKYPGKHLPTFPELKKYLVPLVKNEIFRELE